VQKNKTNFIFWGTPDVASQTLEILKENGYLPSLVVTSVDAKSGRGMQMQASSTALFATANNIPCLKPDKLDQDFALQLSSFDSQLFIVVAYGKIIPEEILNLPKRGSINIHYSLLPKYRGASPVESAILHGDTETGVVIQQMEFFMDKGPILAVDKTEIGKEEKAPELRKRLIKIGGNLLVTILPDLIEGKITPVPQSETGATYSKKIKKEDGLINPQEDGVLNYNKFRAYASWPRTFFFKDNKRTIITDAMLEENKFIIKKIIPEGGKETEYKG